jgi:hypothetical protein
MLGPADEARALVAAGRSNSLPLTSPQDSGGGELKPRA